MPKPLIGITPAFYHHEELDRSILAVNYTDRILAAGGLPVIIPPYTRREDVSRLLDRLDGFILSGGRDIRPERYDGKTTDLIPKPQFERRDRSDFYIVKELWGRRIPTLGICLGLQELNVHLGGSVYQDLPTERPSDVVHRIGEMFEARHDVTVDPSSRLYSAIKAESVETNSAHHQGLRELAEPLVAVAWTEDGLVEGAESRDPGHPVMAVQWHPEMEADDSVGLNLFRWLVEAADFHRTL